MSNWALELQQYDIVRIWIRGEANIMSDAPSRAPWENALAHELPVPDQPIRQLLKSMYGNPDEFEENTKKRAKQMNCNYAVSYTHLTLPTKRIV